MITIGIVSGYFNPLHSGHLDYINAAAKQCRFLIAIVNNDKQVQLKGSKPFMTERHREIIIDNLKTVDETYIAIDQDKTVCATLREITSWFPSFKIKFFNSGDRGGNNVESEEVALCSELGIEYIFIDLPKLYSSSELLKQ